MYPYRGIVRTDRGSDGLYMRPDGPNTLNLQPSSMNDASRYPLHIPVTHLRKNHQEF